MVNIIKDDGRTAAGKIAVRTARDGMKCICGLGNGMAVLTLGDGPEHVLCSECIRRLALALEDYDLACLAVSRYSDDLK